MSGPRVWLGLALLLALLGGAYRGHAQAAEFAVHVGTPADGQRPVLAAPGLLRDRALQNALDSGLPLRFHLRVELWRKGFFDRLLDREEIDLVLLLDPLDREYRLQTASNEQRYASIAEAEGAVAAALRPTLRPREGGRLYYLATLEIETLSLSDLEELRRWLRGEVRPAVEGRAPAGRAVERGLRRVLVRVIGLPTRRYEARSGTFVLR